MLQQFGPEIWIADGAEVEVLGFRSPTRMAVVRLSNRALFIWSPIALTDDLRAAVDALGRVRSIVAPNSLHHLFIATWKAACPEARFYAPPALRDKRKNIAFDAELGDAPVADRAGEIDHVAVTGNLITTEVVFFHAESGAVIFADLLQQFPDRWLSGWRRAVARLDRMIAPEPAAPRKFRRAFTNRRTARAALARILDLPARKVLMAHGAPFEGDAAAFLRRAFRWLTGWARLADRPPPATGCSRTAALPDAPALDTCPTNGASAGTGDTKAETGVGGSAGEGRAAKVEIRRRAPASRAVHRPL